MLNDLSCLTDFSPYPLEQITAPHPGRPRPKTTRSSLLPPASFPPAPFLWPASFRLPDGGHFVTVTHREQVIPSIGEFLSEIWS